MDRIGNYWVMKLKRSIDNDNASLPSLVMLTESEVQTEADATGDVLELPGHCAYCGVIARCTDVHERGVKI